MSSDMDVVVTTEARFHFSAGQVYCPTGGRGYRFWRRYLDVFDTVTVLGRLFPVTSVGGAIVEGPGVRFAALPAYSGLSGFIRGYRELRHAILRQLRPQSAYIARVPSPIGGMLIDLLNARRLPFGVEVVGDPRSLFAPGVLRHPFRPLLRWVATRDLRRQCRMAAGAAYVSSHSLQQDYPPPPRGFTAEYSSVDLPPDAFASHSRRAMGQPATLVHVGTLNQEHKGQHILIDALALLHRRDLPLKLVLVGDGRRRQQLAERARGGGVLPHIEFTGLLNAGHDVRQVLDRCDLFVFPALGGEGVPRALLEAMARGLPAIASDVGGMAEVLPAELLVPPGKVELLADKIAELLANPNRLKQFSLQNLTVAKRFDDAELRCRRRGFYQRLRRQTAERNAEVRLAWT